MAGKPRKNMCNDGNSPPLPAELCCTSLYQHALHSAVLENDATTFDYLVKHNVDLNSRNSFGETPLLMAIKRKGSPALIKRIKRLLDLGCDINITDEYERTPLHVAILYDNVEIAQKLIELGADLDVQDLLLRETPLFYAIKYHKMEVVCMLLCYGADVTIKNALNYTPLTKAMNQPSDCITSILLDYCDDFDYRNNDGYTPLHLVMKYGSNLAIRLIDAGADVNGVTKDGYCSLYFAMKYFPNAHVFKKIWGRMNVDVLLGTRTRYPWLLQYINDCVWPNSNEWVECLYLMLESPVAIDLMGQCASLPMGKGFITQLLQSLQRRHVVSEDRQNIINICLTLGVEVSVKDLDVAMYLFGFKEELKTLIYAAEPYKFRSVKFHHPLLPLVIGLNEFNFVRMIWWCREYIKARHSWEEEEEEEEEEDIFISCLGFFSLTPFWKQQLLQDCRLYSPSEYVEKIQSAREFPSLLELSRNRAHSLVMRKVQKPYQFHDALKSLPLPAAIIDLLLFKRPIYR